MKKRFPLHPISEFLIILGLFIIIGCSVRGCVNRGTEQAQTDELLEYHSNKDYLTVENNGYITRIKQ